MLDAFNDEIRRRPYLAGYIMRYFPRTLEPPADSTYLDGTARSAPGPNPHNPHEPTAIGPILISVEGTVGGVSRPPRRGRGGAPRETPGARFGAGRTDRRGAARDAGSGGEATLAGIGA